MLLPFIIGLFCLLFTIGIFVSEKPLHFSIVGLIVIVAFEVEDVRVAVGVSVCAARHPCHRRLKRI
jgi:hypothetical protein